MKNTFSSLPASASYGRPGFSLLRCSDQDAHSEGPQGVVMMPKDNVLGLWATDLWSVGHVDFEGDDQTSRYVMDKSIDVYKWLSFTLYMNDQIHK
jgi:hypothetical protein